MTEWVDNWEQYKEIRKKYRETNDCMVVSFATVWNAPYESAHQHIRTQFQRKPRRGVPYEIGREQAMQRCPKTKMRAGPYTENNRISLERFCKAHPEGRYWVFVRGHALAVIDGVIYDHSHKPRRMVQKAYRVYPASMYPDAYNKPA